MSVYKRGEIYWYKFYFANRLIRQSAKTSSKTLAKRAEQQRLRELEQGYNNLTVDRRSERIRQLRDVAGEYVEDYGRRHKAITFIEYATGHLVRLLGGMMLVDVTDITVKEYQSRRLKESAAPKTINEEVGILLRLLGDSGAIVRLRLKQQKTLKLAVPPSPGHAYSPAQKEKLVAEAFNSRSPMIFPSLYLALSTGMRDSEIRNIILEQIDFTKSHSGVLIVRRSKTQAGEGRTIPLTSDLRKVLLRYLSWYTERFGATEPHWYLFPFGKSGQYDPLRPITTLKTAWSNVRKRAQVSGRWHDCRHTLLTELGEGGRASEQTIMSIAGHVSKQMLARYSHIGMEAKYVALEAIAIPLPSEFDRSAIDDVPAGRGRIN